MSLYEGPRRVALRPLTAADSPAVSRLLGRDGASAFAELADDADDAAVSRWIGHRLGMGTRLLAVTQITFGTLIGVAELGGSQNMPRLRLWIGRAYRRSGFGLEVVAEVLRLLDDHGVRFLEAHCPAADADTAAFLNRAGFRHLGDAGGAAAAVANWLLEYQPRPIWFR